MSFVRHYSLIIFFFYASQNSTLVIIYHELHLKCKKGFGVCVDVNHESMYCRHIYVVIQVSIILRSRRLYDISNYML